MGNEYENLKRQRYLQLVQQCARSGKSKREWCRENGIKYSTFMRWQRQLREELAEELLAAQEIAPVQVELPEEALQQSTGVLQAASASAVYGEGIEISTGSIHIHLPKDTPASYLASLVKGLV